MESLVVAGRYQVVERLGSGGMGTVYLATDSKTGGQVALKILHPQFADRKKYVSRFEAEATLACRLRHPNVCAGLDRGHEGQAPFFTMEVLTGRSLAQLVAEEGLVFDPDSALKIIGEAAAGLAALVSMSGVIAHRDLSSANIFLESGGHVKIADFGIAKLETGNETGTGSFLGNVNYMSPEQINDPKRVDVRSDIYTLGIVLYELLAGHRPFAGSPTEIANKQLYSQVPPIRLQGHNAGAAQEVLSRTLAKDPSQRFQSPQELVAFIAGAIPDVQMVVPRRRGASGLGRTLAIAAAGVLLIAFVLVLARTTSGNGSAFVTRATVSTSTSPQPTGQAAPLTLRLTSDAAPLGQPLHTTLQLNGVDARVRFVVISQQSSGFTLPSKEQKFGTTVPIELDVSNVYDGPSVFVVKLYDSQRHRDEGQALQEASATLMVSGRPRSSQSGTSGSGGRTVFVASGGGNTARF